MGLALALGPDSAQASMRGIFSIGPWMSSFKQADGSHEAKVTSLLSLGLGGQLGIRASLFFAEYSAAWLVSPYSANPKARDASYFSLLGLNAGIAPPVLPLEPYFGIEQGNYKLNGGVNPSFGGVTLKAGANARLGSSGKGNGGVGVRAEYRRIFISSDEAGTLPDGFSTRSDIYFVGFTFGAY